MERPAVAVARRWGELVLPTQPTHRTWTMTDLPSLDASVPPVALAGLLLAALPTLGALGLPHPTGTAVVDALDVTRSRAYELRAAVLEVLPTLVRPPGRPSAPPAEPRAHDARLLELDRRTFDFLVEHPGAVRLREPRRRYSHAFRIFAIERAAELKHLDLAAIAGALRIPESTLRAWMADERLDVDLPEPADRDPVARALDATSHVEAVLAAWDTWDGDFVPFCEHVQLHLRVPLGRAAISTILAVEGVRIPERRQGRSKDAEALRGQFQVFYPGAQWVGDGTELTVTVGTEVFKLNVELLVDPASGAFVGASVRDHEDAEAVIEAVADGVATTGQKPLAVLLDNKPSNHVDEIAAALGDTLKIRATAFRPENKAHVEGGFGLLFQTMPLLALPSTADPGVLAHALAQLAIQIWGRTVNHRPRIDGRGTRAGLYGGTPPTPDEIAAARLALEQRYRRQEEARKTAAARVDPVVRATLADAFARFVFDDPEGHFAAQIAGYPLDAIVEGIAIFAARQRAGTLPEGVDVRYLLGIVRHVTDENQLVLLTEELWRARLLARDRLFVRLQERRDAIQDDPPDNVEELLRRYVDLALAASRRIDRFFWLRAVVDVAIETESEDIQRRTALFKLAARRISATHRLKRDERGLAIRFLAAKLAPLA